MVKLFIPEYRKQCVDMVLDGKHSVTQVCKMMHVSQSTLNRWRGNFLLSSEALFLQSSGKFNVYERKMSNCVAIMPD